MVWTRRDVLVSPASLTKTKENHQLKTDPMSGRGYLGRVIASMDALVVRLGLIQVWILFKGQKLD